MMKHLILCFLFFLLMPAFFAEGAVIFFQQSRSEYEEGDVFMAEIRIRADRKEETCINALDVKASFPPDRLEMTSFSRGNSIISLWTEFPGDDLREINRKGTFSFSGGIPGSYCGVIPGDPEGSHLLAKVAFRVLTAGPPVVLELGEETTAFLSDGLGTPMTPLLESSYFAVMAKIREEPSDEWRDLLAEDQNPPESFEIELYRHSEMFQGKIFIVFSTTDKESGLDYYEVKEGDRDWKRAESPYVLEDQDLQGIIKVKAVDRAGNERIEEFVPEELVPEVARGRLAFLVFAVLFLIWLIWLKNRKKRS